MNFFKRRAKLKNANYLELVPIKLVAHEVDNGLVTLLLPKFTSKFAKKYIVPKLAAPHIKLKLDEMGSASWLAIDNKKNVAAIAQELHARVGGNLEETEERLLKFFTLLYDQKLISFDILQF
jgi:hypothetical protein